MRYRSSTLGVAALLFWGATAHAQGILAIKGGASFGDGLPGTPNSR